MARFKIAVKLNDGKNEAPPVEVEVGDDPLYEMDELFDAIVEFGTDDNGALFGPGSTINIERLS